METSEQKYQNVEWWNIERPVKQWVNNRNDIDEFFFLKDLLHRKSVRYTGLQNYEIVPLTSLS